MWILRDFRTELTRMKRARIGQQQRTRRLEKQPLVRQPEQALKTHVGTTRHETRVHGVLQLRKSTLKNGKNAETHVLMKS